MSRKHRLFGGPRRVKRAADNALFGLASDGINDYLQYDVLQSFSGSWSVKFKATLVFEASANIYGGSATFNNQLVTRTTTPQFRLGVNGTQYTNSSSLFAFGVHSEYEIVSDGVNVTYLRDGNTIDTDVLVSTNHEIEFIFTRSDFLTFFECTALEYFEINGVRADDSNNWSGITQNGTTRVTSTDGGATWAPA